MLQLSMVNTDFFTRSLPRMALTAGPLFLQGCLLPSGTIHWVNSGASSTTSSTSASASTPTLLISPNSKTLAVNNSFTFEVSGGVAPLFSLISGIGTMTATGVYQAPGTSGTAVVQVTDNSGGISTATVTIVPAITITPTNAKFYAGQNFNFSAANGVSPPYSYSLNLTSGLPGTINALNGAYTSPLGIGTLQVRVIDSIGNFAASSVTVVRSSWLGGTSTTPDGGDPICKTATGTTGGWCTGGAPSSGAQGAYLRLPSDVALDPSGNIYVADSINNRVSKFTSTGAYVGWVGYNGTSVCSWCTSGTPTSGTGDGMLNNPAGVVYNSVDDTILVADTDNHRISKYNASTGAFQGWLGNMGSVGNGTCVAALGAFNGGWCTGGTAAAGTGDGMLAGPRRMALDSTYLYVADGENNRVSRYSISTGAFGGWIGKIVTPGGTCTGSIANWCSGGTSGSGTGDGMLNSPYGVAVDGTYIYVAEWYSHRISRFTLGAGAFNGWIGDIATPPSGGGAGCSGAMASSFTPAWCVGGTSKSGTGDGMLNFPSAILVNGGTLYVADSSNNRILQYHSSTGAFSKWFGGILSTPNGGDLGCSTAPPLTGAPGWCIGGTSTSGYGDGMLNSPSGIFINSAGVLFISDYNNNRIVRVQ
jgi:hypothetical protein